MKLKYIILSVLTVGLFAACSDDNEAARTPDISIHVNKTNLDVNETMEITYTGVADQVVVFTGDNMHEYEKRAESNTGFPVTKGVLTYSYSVPGNFHVTVIASTYDTYKGDNQQIALYEFDVVVIDDNTSIEAIYTTPTTQSLNTYYAKLVDDKDWVICTPAKQVNSASGKEVTFVAAKQKLTLQVSSDSTKVYFDDALYGTNKSYNLTAVTNIHVVAHSGDTRDYRLIGLVYPELSTPKAGEQTLTQVRDAFHQDLLTYKYPAGTDVSNVALTFKVDDNVKFYKNGTEVTSGTTLDLTADAEYTLVRTSDANPLAQAVTNVYFAEAE